MMSSRRRDRVRGQFRTRRQHPKPVYFVYNQSVAYFYEGAAARTLDAAYRRQRARTNSPSEISGATVRTVFQRVQTDR